MCGKLNPGDAEVCQYCQARLKPLTAPIQPPKPPEKGDAVDWLRDLAGRDEGPADQPEAEAPETPAETPAEEIPDWLSRIRTKTKEEADAVSPIGRPPEVEPQPEAPAEETPITPAGSPEDFLQDLRPAEPEESEPAPAEEPPASQPLSTENLDNDEWLRSFSARLDAMQSSSPAEPPSTDEGSLPAGPEGPEETPEPATGRAANTGGTPVRDGGAEIPGWMKALEPLKSTSEQPPAVPEEGPLPPAPEPEAEAPAAAEGPAPVPEAASAESIPDWLKAFAAEEPAAAEAEPAVPEEGPVSPAPEAGAEAAPAEGMPDWLKSFAAEEPEVAAPAEGLVIPEVGPAPAALEAGPEAAPAEGIPDWLKSFAAEEPSAAAEGPAIPEVGPTPAAPEAGAEAAPAEGIPEWLKSFAAEEPAAAAEGPAIPEEGPVPAAPEAGPEAAPAEGVPDWLKAFAAEEPAGEVPAGEATPAFLEGEAAPAEGVPDWLKAYAVPPEGAEAGQQPGEEEPAVPAGESPEWLKAYADHQAEMERQAAPAQEGEQPPSVSPFSEEALPDWLKAGQEQPAGQEEPAPGLIGRTEEELAGPAHPLAGEEVPEWLSQPEEEGAGQIEAAEEVAPESLEAAQMPAWLQAMRPVESAAPVAAEGVDDQRVEKSGPLAGLRGVVRGEDLVTQYQKPPVYSVKLHVSEPQTLRASLMEQVLGSETQAQPVSAESTLAPQYVVRVVTALAMVALILIVLFFGPRPLIPSALSRVDAQVSTVNRLVDNLAPASPVLVAVDYQAPLSGELKIAAQPVIQHLMTRQARLVFVSTNPVGPALAQDLFNSSLGTTGYKTELMANLGYLIGGSTALKAMAAPSSPGSPPSLRDALPLTWSGNGSWNQPALFGLTQVSDFKQVILLTDSVESARDWVEQVQPELVAKNVPLIVVSSAQAAPLLQAYRDSGQFAALISGLAGGANYEQVRQSGGNGTAYFNAYLAGILAAVLFILLGGIVSLVSNLASPKTKRKA